MKKMIYRLENQKIETEIDVLETKRQLKGLKNEITINYKTSFEPFEKNHFIENLFHPLHKYLYLEAHFLFYFKVFIKNFCIIIKKKLISKNDILLFLNLVEVGERFKQFK
jgi:PhoPQ-activated pathogenicity-related protein